jgi:hypothetical protein
MCSPGLSGVEKKSNLISLRAAKRTSQWWALILAGVLSLLSSALLRCWRVATLSIGRTAEWVRKDKTP